MDTATNTSTHSAEFRGRVYDSITETIGHTPLRKPAQGDRQGHDRKQNLFYHRSYF